MNKIEYNILIFQEILKIKKSNQLSLEDLKINVGMYVYIIIINNDIRIENGLIVKDGIIVNECLSKWDLINIYINLGTKFYENIKIRKDIK